MRVLIQVKGILEHSSLENISSSFKFDTDFLFHFFPPGDFEMAILDQLRIPLPKYNLSSVWVCCLLNYRLPGTTLTFSSHYLQESTDISSTKLYSG